MQNKLIIVHASGIRTHAHCKLHNYYCQVRRDQGSLETRRLPQQRLVLSGLPLSQQGLVLSGLETKTRAGQGNHGVILVAFARDVQL